MLLFSPAMKMGFLPLLQVADFGLAKLTEVGSASLHTRLVGTFGYMPPEYDIFLNFFHTQPQKKKRLKLYCSKGFQGLHL